MYRFLILRIISEAEDYFSESEDYMDLLFFPYEIIMTTELEKSGLTAGPLRGRRHCFTS